MRQNLSIIAISLFLAVLVWVAAVREQNPPREGDYESAIVVEVTPPRSDLVNTASLPQTVQLRLLAPTSSWDDLSVSKFKASVDLSQLEAGLADVPVNIEVSDPNITIVSQQPVVASVSLEPLKVITLPVKINVLDAPPLGYVNRTPSAEPDTVEISGPSSVVDKVTEAVAEVFIGNSKETIETRYDVVARDADNKRMRAVTINPQQVSVTIPIQQRFGYKDVSVRVQVDGQVAPGYRISNISVDPPTITVVGNPQGLNEIAGLIDTIPINLNEATESIVRTVPLNLPAGVTTVLAENGGPGGVKVTVEITPIEDAVTLQRPILQQGIDPDYWWRSSPEQVEVFLSGPLSQLRSLKASDVEVLIDLFDLEPGTHILQPTVFMPDGLRLDAILPDSIEITIGKNMQRPFVQTGLDDAYFWTASPNRVNVLLSGPSERLQRLLPTEVSVKTNLAGLGPGLHRVKPIVSVPETVEIDSISPEFINVVIESKVSLSTTATISRTGVVTNSATITNGNRMSLPTPGRATATPSSISKDN